MTSDQQILTHMIRGHGPAVLLLNGGLMSMAAWEPIASALEDRYSVIRCDLRGQYLSPGVPPATLEGHVDDVVQVLDRLDVPTTHVVGTSFGALVGLVLAAKHAQRARSVTAITATDRVTPEMWEAARAAREAIDAAAGGGDGAAVFDCIAPATFSRDYLHRAAAGFAMRRQVFTMLPAHWFASLQKLLGVLRDLDLHPALEKISCPVLVLAGGRDETFPLACSQALAAALSRARLEIVPEGAHGLVVESPDLVVQAIKRFVTEVERGEGR